MSYWLEPGGRMKQVRIDELYIQKYEIRLSNTNTGLSYYCSTLDLKSSSYFIFYLNHAWFDVSCKVLEMDLFAIQPFFHTSK